MNKERVWQEFIALPPEISSRPDLAEEPFIGLWRDRQDMQDSTVWVRVVREREWGGLE